MKKLGIVAILAGLGFSSSTFAADNTGDVNFLGVVTDATCEIGVFVDGVENNTIDLGVMKVDGTGALNASFKLIPTGENAAGCLEKIDGAAIMWQSSSFTTEGIANQSGSAQGVNIKLTAENAEGTNKDITVNNKIVTYAAGEIPSFDYTAKMTPSSGATLTPGTVIATAKYTVAYK